MFVSLSVVGIACRRWRLFVPAVALFAGLWGLALAHPAAASPPNQTIVLPTPTPEVAVPTATPVPDTDDDTDEDNDQNNDGSSDGNNDEGSDVDDLPAIDPDEAAPIEDEAALPFSGGDGAGGLPGGLVDPDAVPIDLADFFITIKDERVSLYAEPSTGASVIGTATQGEQYQVVGRNRGVTWYVVCCTDDGVPGWISTRSIVREFDLVDAVNLPVIEDLSTLDLGFDPALLDDRPLGEIPVAELLAFTVTADPQVLDVGSRVRLTYRVGNIGRHELTDVVVRNLLPDGLEVDQVLMDDGDYVVDETTQTMRLNWPTLLPGQVQTATVEARATPSATRSTVIEYLATLTTDEDVTTSAGVLLGFPPSAIPDFR